MKRLKSLVGRALLLLLGPDLASRLISIVKHHISGPEATPFGFREELPKEYAPLAANYATKRIEGFLLSKRMIALQDKLIANAIQKFFSQTGCLHDVGTADLLSTVSEFRKVFLESPITMNVYGANFPSGMNLFCLARHLSPSTIVESGVYKGQSSYFLSAACPRASVLAFDVNLSQVAYRAPRVVFRENDWTETDVSCSGTGFCFFDDHCNQAERILQAYERGFRYILVDDSWPIEVITGDSWPPLPTIDMIMGDTLDPEESVEWIYASKKWTYVNSRAMSDLCVRARQLIKATHDVPSLYRETGIAPTSAYKFVELI